MSIEIKNVTKRYKEVVALDNVSIVFEENKIYGLLGRNGAGKSTLLDIISNRRIATEGTVLIDGEDINQSGDALTKMYLMSEQTLYPTAMKVKEVFKWSKEFYPNFDIEYANRLAGEYKLKLNKKVKALSTGYSSILKLIVALAVNTKYVMLDEPVLGLDANHRELFYKQLLEKYSETGSTFVISTHLIEEISTLVEDVIIVKNGKIIRSESRDELLNAGYTVTGRISQIDEFIVGKQLLGENVFGGLKTAYVMGKKPEQVDNDIEITKLDLQKLFVRLTDE